jgi:hypothetical protein
MVQVSGCDVELPVVFLASLACALWAFAASEERPNDSVDVWGGEHSGSPYRLGEPRNS